MNIQVTDPRIENMKTHLQANKKLYLGLLVGGVFGFLISRRPRLTVTNNTFVIPTES